MYCAGNKINEMKGTFQTECLTVRSQISFVNVSW
jgi:hypothetical protein